MPNIGQQILSTEGTVTSIAQGALTLISLFQQGRKMFQAENPGVPVPALWDDPALGAAIAVLTNDAAALVRHSQEVQQRQQAALDAEAAANPPPPGAVTERKL